MKKLLMLLAAVGMIFTACENNGGVEEENGGGTPFIPEITYSPKIVEFESVGGEKEVAVTANFEYEVSTNADWLYVEILETGIKVVAEENTKTSERSTNIVISNEKYNITKVVEVKQAAYVPKIELSQQSIEVEFEPATYTVSVTSPYSWDAVSKNDWIVIESETGIAGTKTLSFNVKRNEEEKVREGTITVSNATYNLAAELYVTQKAFSHTIAIEQKVLNFSAEGGEQPVKITANFDYNVTTDADWVKCSSQTKEGITITVPNYAEVEKRTAEITISNEKYGISEVVKVSQAAFVPAITIEKKELNFNVEGGEQSVKITANFDYNVTDNADWIYCTKADNSISIKVLASDIVSERTADIVISNEKYGISEVVKVSQAAFVPAITIEKKELNFDAEGGEQSVKITANFDYNVTDNADWIDCTKVDNSISIKVLASDIVSVRTAEITIANETYGISNTVKVSQCAFVPEISINPESLNFAAERETQEIAITSNFKYEVSTSADWLSYNKTDNGIAITASAHIEMEEQRTAEVTIYNEKYNKSSIIKVSQNGLSKEEYAKYIILYTSSDEKVVTPYKTDVFGANIVSNIYENGKGVIKFDAPVTSIGGYAFDYCGSLASVKIPDSVTAIGYRAFYYCESLTSVTIGNSVTSIGEDAFKYCSSLTSVTIGNSVNSIGDDAFEYCSSLTSVTIGNSVNSIGEYAFANCSSLTSVYCKATTPPSGGKYMFSWNASGRKIYVPTASVSAYKSAKYWNGFAAIIVGYDF